MLNIDDPKYPLTSFRFDIYRAGQEVAVRVTHVPTGTTACSSSFAGMWRNRMEAMRLVRQQLANGSVAERLIAPVSKTGEP